MKEVCSCTAEFEIPDVRLWATAALLEQFKAWRDSHRHEMPAPELEPMPEMPAFVESGSSHERAFDDAGFGTNRVSLGFQRNEVR